MAILEEESLQNEDKESWKHVSFGFKTMVVMLIRNPYLPTSSNRLGSDSCQIWQKSELQAKGLSARRIDQQFEPLCIKPSIY